MALIDAIASSMLYKASVRSFFSGALVATCEAARLAPPIKKESERRSHLFICTLQAAQMTRALPLETLSIAQLHAWAPAALTLMAIGCTVLTPDLNQRFLRAIQVSAIALTLLSACLAPSITSLGAVGAMALGALVAHNQLPKKIVKPVAMATLTSFALVNLTYAVKQWALNLAPLGASLITALVLFIAGRYLAKRLAAPARSEASPEIAAKPLSEEDQIYFNGAYLKALPTAYQAIFEEHFSYCLERELGENAGASSEVYKKYLDYEIKRKWQLICNPSTQRQISEQIFKQMPPESEVEVPDSLYRAWTLGCYSSSITLGIRSWNKDSKVAYINLLQFASAPHTSLEHFLYRVHTKAMTILFAREKVNGTHQNDKVKVAATQHLERFAKNTTIFPDPTQLTELIS